MMDGKEVAAEMAMQQKQAVLDFVNGGNTATAGQVQVCTVVDLYAPMEAAKAKSDALCALVNAHEGNTRLDYKYNYDEAAGRARYTLFAPPAFIARAMAVLG